MKLSFNVIGGSKGEKLLYLDDAVLELEDNKELDVFVKNSHNMIDSKFELENVEFKSIECAQNRKIILNCSSDYYSDKCDDARSFNLSLQFTNTDKLEKFLSQVKTAIKQQKIIQENISCN